MAGNQRHICRQFQGVSRRLASLCQHPQVRIAQASMQVPYLAMHICRSLVVSHTDPKMMTLRSASGTQLVTFRTKKYHQMYHFPQPVNHMDALFYTHNNNVNTKDILKHWIREPSKFRTTPNQVYKTKLLRKACQLLIIFSCRLYGQESTKTFPESQVIVLDHFSSEGRPFNWSDMLALQLKVHVSNAQSLPTSEQAKFYMSVYLLDAICNQLQFPGMGWVVYFHIYMIHLFGKMIHMLQRQIISM